MQVRFTSPALFFFFFLKKGAVSLFRVSTANSLMIRVIGFSKIKNGAFREREEEEKKFENFKKRD